MHRRQLVMSVAFFLAGHIARADVMFDSLDDLASGNAARTLDFLGFDLIGRENPITGGIDFFAVQNFQNARVDWGRGEVALNGPISFEFHTGNRLLRTVSIGFTTALSADATAQPLTYTFTNHLGLQDRSLRGSVLIDGDLAFDQLGFYELNLRYSTRNDRTTDGPLGSDSTTFDADYGPIRMRGNVFIDLAAVMLDPLYERAGRETPLAPFSAYVQAVRNAGDESTLKTIAHGADHLSPTSTAGSAALVPLPSALLILGAGLPFLIRRRRSSN